MEKPKIVFVGHVCIDHNTVEHAKYVGWGSSAMYMAKYIRHEFGIEPIIVASYGADFLPHAQDVKLYPEPSNTPTLVYENIVKKGKRTQYCHHNDTCVPPPIDEKIKLIIAEADILFLAPLAPAFSAAYVSELMANARSGCLKVLLPQGYLRHIADDGLVQPREFEEAADVISYFDLVVLSDEDHPNAVVKAHEWKQASPHTQIIVTENANGADIIQTKGKTHVPTEPVSFDEIVDSVGCGDVFSAATAYHLYQSRDLSSATQKGHAAARKKLITPSRFR